MKSFLSTSEVVETLRQGDAEWEVCAAAEAHYDESASHVVVDLESFLRRTSAHGAGEVRRPEWLPRSYSVKEQAAREEASQVVHDVFASWVRKVRQSIPPLMRSHLANTGLSIL